MLSIQYNFYGFQICLEILGVPNGDEAIFDAAVGAWESVITNDLPNFIPPVAFMDSICPPGERYNPPETWVRGGMRGGVKGRPQFMKWRLSTAKVCPVIAGGFYFLLK